MDILFLGTGSAWRLPEYSCRCMICQKMTELKEERTRTSIRVTTSREILIDPGPDLLFHMRRFKLQAPDLILITHEHGDHYLGMDDLLAYKRSQPPDSWRPIPVYATETAWQTIGLRFGYLLGSIFEKRVTEPGVDINIDDTSITPFKTVHGKTARGSVGYVIRETPEDKDFKKLVYTSDFIDVETDSSILHDPDVLIIQSHWLNEPVENRPSHMSLQRALDFIKKWRPSKRMFLVHISGGDQVPGDPFNNTVKKTPPIKPMMDPRTQKPYSVPMCQQDWDNLAIKLCEDNSLSCPMTVPKDGEAFTF